MHDLGELRDALIPAARAAGRLIEAIRAAGATARDKADASPVTEADEAAERLLHAAIRAVDPDGVIIGEEAHAAGLCEGPCARFWLLDPLDGTKEFIAGRAGYSVNIGLVEAAAPVLGIVLSPRDGVLWAGVAGGGAFRERAPGVREAIATRPCSAPPVAMVSHSHLDAATTAWVDAVGAITESAGSSLKFCRLAEGSADVYPRHGPTMEWDTAAADAVLRAAGGMTHNAAGVPFAYAKAGFRNGPFLAVGDPAAFDRLPAL